MNPVRLIAGGLHRDARGEVRHVNGFDFSAVDRFYSLHPARTGEVRGWVGHLRDWKWFSVPQGTVVVSVARPARWTPPSADAVVEHFKLTADSPSVLEIPPGHFTASVAGERGSILLVFSSGKIETAGEDDYRVPADFWNAGSLQ